jgi:hypothetical protein
VNGREQEGEQESSCQLYGEGVVLGGTVIVQNKWVNMSVVKYLSHVYILFLIYNYMFNYR